MSRGKETPAPLVIKLIGGPFDGEHSITRPMRAAPERIWVIACDNSCDCGTSHWWTVPQPGTVMYRQHRSDPDGTWRYLYERLRHPLTARVKEDKQS